ncbi:MAG TPA: glycine C-acetyltransferase [Steroidobacteraceae bacterium]|nr:glycine C-acetyltransferase [Steroidobacteraceae bacterium]
MTGAHFYDRIRAELQEIQAAGLEKSERLLATAQGAIVRTVAGREAINLCANNYLGLSNHPAIIAGAQSALHSRGFGLSSVRFICGTQDLHKELEGRLTAFLGTQDTILYSSAFDANGGLFEPLLGAEDAVISDALNHASVIDGIRLCKAKRYRYAHADLADLERQLRQARADGARDVLIFTDGVFSMDGTIAQLDRIRALADRYDALLGIDDSHASGFVGRTGRGTHEHCGVLGRIDIITGTLGKALGGASGGFTSGSRAVIELLRQRSRPYLFSNSVAPAVIGGSLAALELIGSSTALRDRLERNAAYFRQEMTAAGFDLKPGMHPIIPIMVYEAVLAQKLAQRLLELGVYAVGFFYPVVPHGQARIRTQISAVHELEHLRAAVEAFRQAGRELQILH